MFVLSAFLEHASMLNATIKVDTKDARGYLELNPSSLFLDLSPAGHSVASLGAGVEALTKSLKPVVQQNTTLILSKTDVTDAALKVLAPRIGGHGALTVKLEGCPNAKPVKVLTAFLPCIGDKQVSMDIVSTAGMADGSNDQKGKLRFEAGRSEGFEIQLNPSETTDEELTLLAASIPRSFKTMKFDLSKSSSIGVVGVRALAQVIRGPAEKLTVSLNDCAQASPVFVVSAFLEHAEVPDADITVSRSMESGKENGVLKLKPKSLELNLSPSDKSVTNLGNGLEILAESFKRGFETIKVNLSKTDVTDVAVKVLAPKLSGHGVLTVNLEECPRAKPAGVLSAFLQHVVDATVRVGVTVSRPLESGKESGTLELTKEAFDLTLSHTQLGDAFFTTLASSLKRGFKNIKLNLSKTNVTAGGLKILAQGMSVQERLKVVLEDCGEAEPLDMLGPFLQYIGEAPSVQVKMSRPLQHPKTGNTTEKCSLDADKGKLLLNLSSTQLTDKGIEAMHSPFASRFSIIELDLSKTDVTDQGVKLLSKSIMSSDRSSVAMTVDETQVTMVVVQALAELSAHVTKLKVHMRACPLIDPLEVLAAFARSSANGTVAVEVSNGVPLAGGLEKLHFTIENGDKGLEVTVVSQPLRGLERALLAGLPPDIDKLQVKGSHNVVLKDGLLQMQLGREVDDETATMLGELSGNWQRIKVDLTRSSVADLAVEKHLRSMWTAQGLTDVSIRLPTSLAMTEDPPQIQ